MVNLVSNLLNRCFQRSSHKLVLVVRTDLGMKKGKIAAQCSHATLGTYKQQVETKLKANTEALETWQREGSAKVVLRTKNLVSLLAIKSQAEQLGIAVYLVKDAGRSQVEAGSITVLALGPSLSTCLDKVTKDLKLL